MGCQLGTKFDTRGVDMGSKAEALQNWRNLPTGQNPLEHMRPIPYKAEGSRYGACGIRIDGDPAFIDAVLSNLKPLIAGENQVTRLELARSEVKPTEINGQRRTFDLASGGAQVCYVRLHVRGSQGAMMQGFMRTNADATATFEKVNKYAR